MMNNPSDASNFRPQRKRSPRYQPIRELSRNQAGGRMTYLGKDNATGKPVVLKRFAFINAGSQGANYPVNEQRIQGLLQLDHPNIPRYLDCFQTADGFCLVQEYKQAQSLAAPRNFEPDEIKRIGVSVLEILVYLHQQNPPVIHQNLKPENILLDDQFNVYLVDFGLPATAAEQSGFAAPEQASDRALTAAADLYALGATLICLLTQTNSTEMNTLLSSKNWKNSQNLVAKRISLSWIDWLEKMVSSFKDNPYPNAKSALKALNLINAVCVPDVNFISSDIEFKATTLGEKLTQTVTISNSILDTVLQGNWEVAPSTHDPRRSAHSHAWISFVPPRFQSNRTDCKIIVDTSKLMANKTYERQILLHTNSFPETYSFNVKVKTAPLAILKLPLVTLGLLFLIAAVAGWLSALMMGQSGATSWEILMLGLVIGCVAGGGAVFSGTELLKKMLGVTIGLATVAGFMPGMGLDLNIEVGFILGLIVSMVGGTAIKHYFDRQFPIVLAITISLLTAAVGMSLGVEFIEGLSNLFVRLALAGTGLSLVTAIALLILQNKTLIDNYRKTERYLIKP